MDQHRKIAAWLRVLAAFLLLLACLFPLGVVRFIMGQAHDPVVDEFFGGLFFYIMGVVMLVLGLEIAVSICLLCGMAWARPGMVALGVLDLLNFPLGTALGIYTLWAMLYEPKPSPASTAS